ncbi:MAG: hypothetical protein QOD56_494 [Gammaproteobacteria bacterium]|jgi:hypothetical protein|nr:hypothetical protein [Gammaproteobacteria bacterium]
MNTIHQCNSGLPSPIVKRIVQSMTLPTRQCEYGPSCPGRDC